MPRELVKTWLCMTEGVFGIDEHLVGRLSK